MLTTVTVAQVGFAVLALVAAFAVIRGSCRGGEERVADAAMQGDKAAVRALIAKKADVNAPQNDGATALHWAAFRGNLELAEILIRAGANPKAANREGVDAALARRASTATPR